MPPGHSPLKMGGPLLIGPKELRRELRQLSRKRAGEHLFAFKRSCKRTFVWELRSVPPIIPPDLLYHKELGLVKCFKQKN